MTKSTDIVVGNFLVTFCFSVVVFLSFFFRISNNKYSARSTFSSRVASRLSLHVAYLKNKNKKDHREEKETKSLRFTYWKTCNLAAETLTEIRLQARDRWRVRIICGLWQGATVWPLEVFFIFFFFVCFFLQHVGTKKPVAKRQQPQNSPKTCRPRLHATLHSSECQKVEVCYSLYSGTWRGLSIMER